MSASVAVAHTRDSRRRRPFHWPLAVMALLGVLTTLPYIFAALSAPEGKVYTGLMLDAPDTLQYFSWLRDHREALLVPNRMTSQPNEPALFNVLWLALARLQNLTGWSNALIYQVLRLVGGAGFAAACWWFLGLAAGTRRAQGWAWLLAMCGGGLGIVWVIEKYLRDLPGARYPLDLYVAEPNTLLNLLAYPHFLAAGGLVLAVLAAALRAARGSWGWWIAAAALALALALQHAYDLLTIYAALGIWLGLLALRERRIPWRDVGGAFLVGVVSFPPAAYFAWLTSQDPMWRAVLSQFSNAGVWTPNPPHLLILIGAPLIAALIGWDGFSRLWSRTDGELLTKAWALAGLVLIYVPLNFQIHLLNPWQVPIALLAVWGVQRRIAPWLARHNRRLAGWALPVLLALSLPTNLYLVAWRFIDLARYNKPWFLEADEARVLALLSEQATRDDVVLSQLELGQFVAADTDARAVLAHWAQTVEFYQTTNDVAAVLDQATPDRQRQALLRRYGATYVLASHPLADAALDEVLASDHAVLYKVDLVP